MAKRKIIPLPDDSFWPPEDYLKNPDLITTSELFMRKWAHQMTARCEKQGSWLTRLIKDIFGITIRRLEKISSFSSRWENIKHSLSQIAKYEPRLNMLEQMVSNVKKADPNCNCRSEAIINDISDKFSSDIRDLNFDLIELTMDMEDFQTNL